MKSIVYLILLILSTNSFAFFGLFEKKVDPMSLRTYEERMEYLLNHDPVFKKFWTERKSKLDDIYEANLKEFKNIEEEISESGRYNPEAIKKMKEDNEKRAKILFDQKMKDMEAQLLQEWIIVDGEFINIKENNEKQEKLRKERESLRRVQQFQSEEGLPVAGKMEDVNINVD